MSTRDMIVERSWGKCEAMLQINGTWIRCGIYPVEIHHMLTRARGGTILDAVGEEYHLIALCRNHHDRAHKGDGLMLDGYVSTDDHTGAPVYDGPDDYLSAKYPRSERAHTQGLDEGSSDGPADHDPAREVARAEQQRGVHRAGAGVRPEGAGR